MCITTEWWIPVKPTKKRPLNIGASMAVQPFTKQEGISQDMYYCSGELSGHPNRSLGQVKIKELGSSTVINWARENTKSKGE